MASSSGASIAHSTCHLELTKSLQKYEDEKERKCPSLRDAVYLIREVNSREKTLPPRAFVLALAHLGYIPIPTFGSDPAQTARCVDWRVTQNPVGGSLKLWLSPCE